MNANCPKITPDSCSTSGQETLLFSGMVVIRWCNSSYEMIIKNNMITPQPG